MGRALTAAAFAQGGAWATLEGRLAALRAEVPEAFQPTLPPPPPTPWSGDLLKDASDLFAGWADTLTAGVTSWIRQGLDYDDVVNSNSSAYGAGALIGQVHNIGLMLLGGAPVAGFMGTALKGLNAAATVGGVYHGVEAIRHGDYLNGLMALGGAGVAAFRGVGVSAHGRALTWGVRGLHAGNAVILGVHGFEAFKNGDYVGALINFADAGANLLMISRSCFVAGTPLLTPGGGSRKIEEFVPGDWVLTRSEFDADGPLEARQVVQTFVRVSPIVRLYVSGLEIGTTREHPFFVEGQGWLPASELRGGERLLSHTGEWLVLEGVAETGEVVTVHNLEVEECHTYFVGGDEWGFSVWAHNAQRLKGTRG